MLFNNLCFVLEPETLFSLERIDHTLEVFFNDCRSVLS